MSNALGQMPNAPLIYVLAQIRFSPVPKMAQHREDIHEKLFAAFPISEEERIQSITIHDGTPAVGESIQRWHLLSTDRKTGVILTPDSIALHTTKYANSAGFFQAFADVLEQCGSVLPKGVRVLRCGLRYVDLLQPEKGLTVDDQVVEAFRLPAAGDIGELERMEQIVTYRTPVDGVMDIRHRQSVTPELLPADLFPNKLAVSVRLTREFPQGQVVGLLDYDHYQKQEMDFDSAELIKRFIALHEISSAAFKQTTTEEARMIWNQEEP